MSFNKITLVGNLGRDPELRYTPQGNPVCSFTLATNERRRDKSGEFQDITLWFRVTLWGNMAENAAKYLSKGRPVYIEGRLRVEEWTDRDNNQRYTLEVNATDMQFIGSRADGDSGEYTRNEAESFSGPPRSQSSESNSQSATAGSSAPPAPPAGDDDIPF